MANVSQDKLLELVDSRYSLVTLAAKRAKQIREGAPRLINTDSTNPLTVALEEIAAGKISYSVPDHDEPLVMSVEEPELMGLPSVPETEDVLPIPEDVEEPMPTEAAAVETTSLEAPEIQAEEAQEDEEETTPAEVDASAEMDTPESTATEQASQPED